MTNHSLSSSGLIFEVFESARVGERNIFSVLVVFVDIPYELIVIDLIKVAFVHIFFKK